MNQKTFNDFSYLNNKQISVYIGRVPCKMKHIKKELSVFEKENQYGKYEKITITIKKTHFNGKLLTIIPKYFECVGILSEFKLDMESINSLEIIS